MKNAMLILALMAAPLLADNLTLTKSAEHLTGAAPSSDTYGFSIDSANQFNGLENYGELPAATFSEIVANTNSAEFLAWNATLPEAQEALDEALGQEMLNNFIAAIGVAWPDIVFTGSRKQFRKLSRRLTRESKQYSAIFYDETKPDDERVNAAAELHKLEIVSTYATQLGLVVTKK